VSTADSVEVYYRIQPNHLMRYFTVTNINTIEFIEEPDEYHALSMMIQCQGGAVIANSTFSWWGAILGSHYSKSPVVYPLKWCGEETVILFPQEWRGF
jgi:hypothetical protein